MTLGNWLLDGGGTLVLGVLGWVLALAQFVWDRVDGRSQRKEEARRRRDERFRDERRQAYGAIVAELRAATANIARATEVTEESQRAISASLGSVRLLAPPDVVESAEKATFATLGLVAHRKSVDKLDETVDRIQEFEAAARRDLDPG